MLKNELITIQAIIRQNDGKNNPLKSKVFSNLRKRKTCKNQYLYQSDISAIARKIANRPKAGLKIKFISNARKLLTGQNQALSRQVFQQFTKNCNTSLDNSAFKTNQVLQQFTKTADRPKSGTNQSGFPAI